MHKVANFKREDKKVIFKEMALLKIVAENKIKKALNACKKYNPVILDKTNKSASNSNYCIKKRNRYNDEKIKTPRSCQCLKNWSGSND